MVVKDYHNRHVGGRIALSGGRWEHRTDEHGMSNFEEKAVDRE